MRTGPAISICRRGVYRESKGIRHVFSALRSAASETGGNRKIPMCSRDAGRSDRSLRNALQAGRRSASRQPGSRPSVHVPPSSPPASASAVQTERFQRLIASVGTFLGEALYRCVSGALWCMRDRQLFLTANGISITFGLVAPRLEYPLQSRT